MATVDIRPFEEEDAEDIAAPVVDRRVALADRPRRRTPDVHRARVGRLRRRGARDDPAEAAPGLVGWAQALGDGVLQSHLGFVAVHPDHRRRGIGRLLVVATFQATRTKRMDLITDTAQGFYANFAHKRMTGFRIYPGA